MKNDQILFKYDYNQNLKILIIEINLKYNNDEKYRDQNNNQASSLAPKTKSFVPIYRGFRDVPIMLHPMYLVGFRNSAATRTFRVEKIVRFVKLKEFTMNLAFRGRRFERMLRK